MESILANSAVAVTEKGLGGRWRLPITFYVRERRQLKDWNDPLTEGNKGTKKVKIRRRDELFAATW